jgi:copper homeostasis protein
MTPVLEVIASSVADAVAAANGGARRLEVVRDLERGGLTPSWELVQEIKNSVDLPLRVMLRESDGFGTSGEDEVDRLCAAAERFGSLQVDGFVLGFLRGGEIDVELTGRVLACAPRVKATFHHAFEGTSDKLGALSAIKQLPQVDRVLSHGGTDDLDSRVQRLGQYDQAAGTELTILAGGGLDGDAISRIARDTHIREFHVGRAARASFRVEGEVQTSVVRALVERMRFLFPVVGRD